MSVLLRSQIQTKINNWITTNGNKEITGAQMNEILTNIIDSGFLQLDELRTALSISYTTVGNPSDWLGGVAPATQNLVNDQLAARINALAAASTTEIWVDQNGDNGSAEPGNPLQPYQTLPAAVAAAPSSNFIIRCMGGTFTLGATLTISNKTDFVLDLSSTTINGDITIQNCTDGGVILEGGTINGFLNIGAGTSQRIDLRGGTILNTAALGSCLNIGEGSFVFGVRMRSTQYIALQASSTDFNNRPVVSTCRIQSDASAAIFGVGTTTFIGCFVTGNRAFEDSPSIYFTRFINCTLIGTTLEAIRGNNGLHVDCRDCIIVAEATGQNAILMGNNCERTRFYNCKVIADVHCINVLTNIQRNGDDTVIQDCNFYPQQGGISGKVLEDTTGYGTDTGVFRFIRNTYSQTWTTSTGARAVDYNSTEITNLTPDPY